MAQQYTIASDIIIDGIGLHSGVPVSLRLLPAAPDAGIVFVRTDVAPEKSLVHARWDCVVDTKLCTVVGNAYGVTVGTIEHLMAALRGCGVDNVVIEIDGPEIPAVDGSSAPFVRAIMETGIVAQSSPRVTIRVLKKVSVTEGDKCVSLSPADLPSFAGEIDFNHPAIGRQSYEMTLVNGNFRHELADARTFGFVEEVEYLKKIGLARGGSLDNAIVLNRDGILNDSGLRFEDEFIRHKLLDAIGDLYLAGSVIQGRYDAARPSHDLNNRLLRALFADSSAYEIVGGASVRPVPEYA